MIMFFKVAIWLVFPGVFAAFLFLIYILFVPHVRYRHSNLKSTLLSARHVVYNLTLPTDREDAFAKIVPLPVDQNDSAGKNVSLPSHRNSATVESVPLPSDEEDTAATSVSLPTDQDGAAANSVPLPSDQEDTAAKSVSLPSGQEDVVAKSLPLPTDQNGAAVQSDPGAKNAPLPTDQKDTAAKSVLVPTDHNRAAVKSVPVSSVHKDNGSARSRDGLAHKQGVVLMFTNAFVNTGGNVFTDGAWARLPYHGCGHPKFNGKDLWESVCAKRNYTADNVVVLSSGNADRYYHFVAELLPRLMHVYDENPELLRESGTRIHHNCAGYGFCTQWPELLGVSAERLVSGCWHARTVAWPPTIPKCGQQDLHALRSMNLLLRRRMAAAVPVLQTPSQEEPRVLLIERIKVQAKKRFITNYLELREALRKIAPALTLHADNAKATAASQCGKFYEADVVVGPHGAGFVNIICCRPGTHIIEITAKEGYNQVFVEMADKLDFNHRHIATRPPFTFKEFGGGTVNVSGIEDAVAMALRQRQLVAL